jgi:hypothetical protein
MAQIFGKCAVGFWAIAFERHQKTFHRGSEELRPPQPRHGAQYMGGVEPLFLNLDLAQINEPEGDGFVDGLSLITFS